MTATAETVGATGAAQTTFHPWQQRAVWLVPLVGYLAFVLFGLTTSSIGISYLRADPMHPLGFQVGSAQPFRSDEWETESPIILGYLASGGQDAVNPLSVSPNYFSQLPSGAFSSVTFFESSLIKLLHLPDTMAFAAKWWLPALLLVIFVPLWFQKVTGSLRWGYLAAGLILFAPSTMWWSMRPVSTLGFMFAWGWVTLVAAAAFRERRWTRFGLLALAAAVLFARFPSYYQPLAIVVGIPVAFATAACVLGLRIPWRDRLASLGVVGLSSLGLTAATAWESKDALGAGLATVYPGDRITTGEQNPLGKVFGATTMGWLDSMNGNSAVTNSVEVATAFTVLLPVLVVLVLFSRGRWHGSRAHLWAFLVAVAFAVLWVAWCTVDWGALGMSLPLLNRVPSYRAANASGFPAAVAFCLYMAQWPPVRRLWPALTAGSTAAAITVAAGWSLRHELLPGLFYWMAVVAGLVTGVLVVLLVRYPRSLLVTILTIIAAASLVYNVNPIVVGLADLRASGPAQLTLQAGLMGRQTNQLWATDDRWVDALLQSSGVPSLSGRQQIGPVGAQWRRLDPTLKHLSLWNRGGTHLEFTWTGSPQITWVNEVMDSVEMQVSPCTVKAAFPQLTHIVASEPREESCLVPDGTFDWAGYTRYVYEVR